MLSKLEKILQSLYQFAIRRPRTVLLAFLIIFISLVPFVNNIKVHIMAKDIIETSSSGYQNIILLEDTFKVESSLYVFFEGNLNNKKTLCDIDFWSRKYIFDRNNFKNFNSPFLFRGILNNKKTLRFPPLLDLHCSSTKNNIDLLKFKHSPWNNILYSSSNKLLGMEFIFYKPEQRGKFGHYDPILIESLKNDFKNPDIKMHLTGSLGYFYYAWQGMTHYNYLNFFILIAMLLLCRIFIGTFRSGVLLMISLVSTGGILFGIIGLFNIPMDLLNNGLFLIVAVSGVQDFLFLSSKKLRSDQSNEKIISNMLLPSFFTSFTTVLGFGSLCFTDIEIIQRFGYLAALGAMLEWISTFMLLPAFMEVFKSFQNWANNKKALLLKFNNKILGLLLPKKIAFFLLLIYIIGPLAFSNLKYSESVFEIFSPWHDFRKGVNIIRTEQGWETFIEVVFNDYSKKEKNNKIIKKISDHPLVAFSLNPYTIENYYLKHANNSYRLNLIKRIISNSDNYKSFINKNMARSQIFLKENKTSRINNLLKLIEIECQDDCLAAGEIVAYTDFSNKVPKVLMKSFIISLILVALTIIMLCLYRRIQHLWKYLLSAMWGPFMAISIIWVVGFPINFMTCIFISVLVGLTGDNVIQYILASKNCIEDGIKERENGSIEIFLFILLISLVFQFSYFHASRILGILLVIGMFTSLIGDLWILKALIPNKKGELK